MNKLAIQSIEGDPPSSTEFTLLHVHHDNDDDPYEAPSE